MHANLYKQWRTAKYRFSLDFYFVFNFRREKIEKINALVWVMGEPQRKVFETMDDVIRADDGDLGYALVAIQQGEQWFYFRDGQQRPLQDGHASMRIHKALSQYSSLPQHGR